MTYTTVYRKYVGATLAEAAAQMLRDEDVWAISTSVDLLDRRDGGARGEQQGYAIVRWEWEPGTGLDEGTLTVWYR